MSLSTFARVWSYSPATGNTFLVHLAMADLSIAGIVQAAQPDIALLARCSVETVARSIPKLVEMGVLIPIEERAKPPIFQLASMEDFPPREPVTDDDPVSSRGAGPESEPFRAATIDTPQNDGILQNDWINGDTSHQIAGGAPSLEEVVALMDSIPEHAPPPVAPQEHSFQALARSAVPPQEADPAKSLQAFLRALGVQPDPAMPLYWYRDEHVQAFEGLLLFAGKTAAQLISEVQAAGIKMPDLRRIPDINDRLAAAKIIPF